MPVTAAEPASTPRVVKNQDDIADAPVFIHDCPDSLGKKAPMLECGNQLAS